MAPFRGVTTHSEWLAALAFHSMLLIAFHFCKETLKNQGRNSGNFLSSFIFLPVYIVYFLKLLANCRTATDIAGVATIIKTTCQGELNVLE